MCYITCCVPRTPLILPFPGPDRPACSALLFNNYLTASLSSSERAIPHFGRGPGAAGGVQRRSAGLDSLDCPVAFGQILGVPRQHLARNVLHAGPCRRHRLLHPKEACQTGKLPSFLGIQGSTRQAIIILDTHGTSGKEMRQLPVSDVSCCAKVLQVRVLTLCDAFHGQHCHDDTFFFRQQICTFRHCFPLFRHTPLYFCHTPLFFRH
jgi:hypothetical protein